MTKGSWRITEQEEESRRGNRHYEFRVFYPSAYIPAAFHLWIRNEVRKKTELDVAPTSSSTPFLRYVGWRGYGEAVIIKVSVVNDLFPSSFP